MARTKRYMSLAEYLACKEKGQFCEGYIIGYGYAFFESIAIKPPHLLMNDSICPWRVPYDMSFHQMGWSQNLDRSPEAIMESFGDNSEYLVRELVREHNGMQYVNMGYGEILELPVENTKVSINMSSTGKITLHVKSLSETRSIERSVAIDMEHFHTVFNNPNFATHLTTDDGISWAGIAGTAWGIAQSTSVALGGGAKSILINRGAYLPRGEILKFTTDLPVTVRTPVVNINTSSKVLNGVRVAGKAVGVAGGIVTAGQIIGDIRDEEFYSAGARAIVWGVAGTAAFIPVVGWGVSLSIGVADAIWGERLYEWIEEEW